MHNSPNAGVNEAAGQRLVSINRKPTANQPPPSPHLVQLGEEGEDGLPPQEVRVDDGDGGGDDEVGHGVGELLFGLGGRCEVWGGGVR